MKKEALKDTLSGMKLSKTESEVIKGGASNAGAAGSNASNSANISAGLDAWICFTKDCSPACNTADCTICISKCTTCNFCLSNKF
ncbi:MAG: hypothetical protein LBK03_08590 [Bacteroidales bacterium]|nr:hypothetical protein [Bacteroidales bacterium]